MSGEWTEEQSIEAAELIRAVMPVVGILATALEGEQLDLLRQAIREVDADHHRKEAGSVAYMAMGVDLDRHATFQNQKRNVRILKRVVDLVEEVHRVREDEARELDREAAREAWVRGMGL